MISTAEQELALTKHEGAGNDFLVLVDPDRSWDVDAAMVRALCRRHQGVGADGFIRVGAGQGGADVSMELWNADGSVAEMSGNGIRCLVQAAVDSGLVSPPEVVVSTAAGFRRVTYRAEESGGRRSEGPSPEGWASVDMGTVRLGAELHEPGPGRRAREVDVGNPHVVCYGPEHPDQLAVSEIGARIDAGTPGGTNVEFVAPGPAAGELVLRVWERGVGETLACGTGTCAAAAAARSWGLVGDLVPVHNPGGTLEVRFEPLRGDGQGDSTGDHPGDLTGDPSGDSRGDRVTLAGPVRRVARVLVDASWLDRTEVR